METVTRMFELTVNPLELVLRGTLLYLALVLTMRFILRRDVGSMSPADVLFIVLIADAAQNGMSADYRSVTDGVVLMGTLVAWNVVLDWLSYRSEWWRRLLEPPAIPVIRNGKLLRANLRRQWITVEEVNGKLRENGIEDIALVKAAFLESSGELGIIRVDGANHRKPKSKLPGAG